MVLSNKIPFVIAINKIDMPSANIDKVEEELIDYGIELETYGGNVPSVPISARSGENVDLLIELIEEDLKNVNLKSDIKN